MANGRLAARAGSRWAPIASRAGWSPSRSAMAGSRTRRPGPAVVTFRAADGAVAECHVPFPPLPGPGRPSTAPRTRPRTGAGSPRTCGPSARSGVLLVRLGGYAAGVFTGPAGAQLAASKVGSRLVHGRSAAGGQSQQRFARRREKQASEALGAAADTAAAVFGPYQGQLDAVVLGGDRRAIAGAARRPEAAAVLRSSPWSGSSPCPTPGSPCCAARRGCSARSGSGSPSRPGARKTVAEPGGRLG